MTLSGRGTRDGRGHHLLLLRIERLLLVEGLRVDAHAGHLLLLLHVLCGGDLAFLGVEVLELFS